MNKKPILLVEDDPAQAELARRAFNMTSRDHELIVLQSLQDTRHFLAENVPAIAFVDLHLPDGAGTELLSGAGNAEYPIVILTSDGSEALAVQAIKTGALDYLVKT